MHNFHRSSQARATIIFLSFFLPGLLLIGLVGAAHFHELSMNEQGQVYEINHAAGGDLWISDYAAGEVWSIASNRTSYSVYSNLPGATDAKVDDQGNLWWVNFDDNKLGYLPAGKSEATIWPLGGASTATGLTFDPAGKVWISHLNAPKVQRFDLGATQLCTFTFPAVFDDYSSWYIDSDQDNNIWLAGSNASSLGRVFLLDHTTDTMTGYGPFAFGSNPIGLDSDGSGGIWWADSGLGELAHLDPGTNVVSHYELPSTVSLNNHGKIAKDLKGKTQIDFTNASTNQPVLIDVAGDRIWYTDFANGRAGKLAPKVALSTTEVIASLTDSVVPICQGNVSGSAHQIAKDASNPTTWVTATVTSLMDGAGWAIYALPASSAPWDLTIDQNLVWITQQERQTLGRLEFNPCYYLTLSSIGSGAELFADPTNSNGCSEGQYLAGEVITLTAAAGAGYAIAGWSGTADDQSITSTNSLTMPASDHRAGVEYSQCHSLSLNHTGMGADPVANPENYPGCQIGRFIAGTLISLTAAPTDDWVVSGWLGSDDDSARSLTNTATMPNGDHAVTVIYRELRQVFLPLMVR